jgi:hypothetical protein
MNKDFLNACKDGNIEFIRKLIKHGYYVNAKNGADAYLKDNYGRNGRNALTIAQYFRYYKIIKILTRHTILVPFMNRRFKKINKDIIREQKNYIG